MCCVLRLVLDSSFLLVVGGRRLALLMCRIGGLVLDGVQVLVLVGGGWLLVGSLGWWWRVIGGSWRWASGGGGGGMRCVSWNLVEGLVLEDGPGGVGGAGGVGWRCNGGS
ncbi:hypothetical protein Tco_0252909 [Tanacetum coccineum]